MCSDSTKAHWHTFSKWWQGKLTTTLFQCRFKQTHATHVELALKPSSRHKMVGNIRLKTSDRKHTVENIRSKASGQKRLRSESEWPKAAAVENRVTKNILDRKHPLTTSLKRHTDSTALQAGSRQPAERNGIKENWQRSRVQHIVKTNEHRYDQSGKTSGQYYFQ